MLEKATHELHDVTLGSDGGGTLGALARCRHSVLQQAATLFDNNKAIPFAVLMQRGAVEERVQHYHQLFQYAPAPSFVTDIYGAIQEANLAALALFRREATHLEHKPAQALVPPAARGEFRRQLGRLEREGGVSDWRLAFNRVGDLPVTVSAAVSFVPKTGQSGSGRLYWMLRVLGEP